MANKAILVEKLHARCRGISAEDIKYMLGIVFAYMKEELSKDNRIELRGLGSFSIRKRKYPKTEQQYNTVYYRMSSKIQKDLNKDIYKS